MKLTPVPLLLLNACFLPPPPLYLPIFIIKLRVKAATAPKAFLWVWLLLPSSCFLLALTLYWVLYLWIQLWIQIPLRECEDSIHRPDASHCGVQTSCTGFSSLQARGSYRIVSGTRAHEVMPSWPPQNAIPRSAAVKIEHSNNLLFTDPQQNSCSMLGN